ncbi:DUF5009 domain-containing protein [Thermophagus sp. OGC60D27]|uniref:DUF5009 domain-containing protein n=1 Tax=Thermophagus sp. OGC60D27 TaxID=3458415 RepID=UPI0040378E91
MTRLNSRFQALDFLRGFAILLMVFSGTIPFGGVLPGWMYHAQLPPPEHVFNPQVPGITWVDLVFPMFLFSMGTAIPFSVGKRIEKRKSRLNIIGYLFWRFWGLVLFAVIAHHVRPWGFNASENGKWALALIVMLGVLLAFASPISGWWYRKKKWFCLAGWVLLSVLFFLLDKSGIHEFSVRKFDVIIMVLANTSVGGIVLYLLYRRWNDSLLVGFVLIATFFLGSRDGNNWVEKIFNWSPCPWLISWNYLKYLIVLIPGIYIGSLVRDSINRDEDRLKKSNNLFYSLYVFFVSGLVVTVSIIGLYFREMLISFLVVILLLCLLYFLLKRGRVKADSVVLKAFSLGTLLILMGFFIEPLQGGIKKDPATLSYLIFTAGLSIISLIGFWVLSEGVQPKGDWPILSGAGKNPMLAYLVGSNIIIPFLGLTGLDYCFANQDFPVGFALGRAVLITLGVGWICSVAAHKNIFMKV